MIQGSQCVFILIMYILLFYICIPNIYIHHHTFMTQTDLIKGFVRLHPISRNMHHSPTHKKYTFYTCYFLSKSHMKTLIYREFSSPCEAMKNCGLYSWKKLITVSTKIPNTSRKCSKDDSILNYMHATCIFLSLHWINSRELLNLKSKILPIVSTSITLQHTA